MLNKNNILGKKMIKNIFENVEKFKKIKKIGKKKKIIHKILKNIINIAKNIKKYFYERC